MLLHTFRAESGAISKAWTDPRHPCRNHPPNRLHQERSHLLVAASVQSHIAARRASGSKPSMLASSKIIERASLETAAQTCSRYSFSSILSPLAFSTRECLEKISSAEPRHSKIASAPTTPSSARRGIHSCIRRGNACNTARQSATFWRAAASLAFSRGPANEMDKGSQSGDK
jgi:hypothetical protein